MLAALGAGALLSSGALVGLAERQPLGTQRDIALGAADAADRVAHALSFDRPAAELAAAFEDEQQVYDVEALIARARASAPAAPAPAAAAPAEPEEEATAGADTEEAADVAPGESGASESALGPPTDGIITPIIGIDCVPIGEDEPQPSGDEGESAADTDAGDSEPDPGDDSEGPPGAGEPDAEPDPDEDASDGTSTVTTATATALDGSDPAVETPAVEDPAVETPAIENPAVETPAIETGADATADSGEGTDDEPDSETGRTTGTGDEPDSDTGGTTTDAGTGSPGSGECPPGYAPAGEADPPVTPEQPAEDEATDPGGEEDTAAEVTFDAPRTPDEENPLEMYVGGDSISRDLGEGLARVTPADVVRIDLDPRPATGLSRPDFFDWSQHLAGVLTESSPDVIVVLFGANDFQNVEYEGEILDRFDEPWLDLYRERVGRIMTLLSQPDTQTIWVGQPPVRESRLSGGLAMLNEVYADQAAEHPQVTYTDTWEVFSDTDGGYVDEIDGVRLRREDGVHLTVAGGNRLAEVVWSAVSAAWGLE